MKKKRITTNIHSNRAQFGLDLIIKNKTNFTSVEKNSFSRSKKSNLRKLLNEKDIKSDGIVSKNKRNQNFEKYNSNIGKESKSLKSYNNIKIGLKNNLRAKSNKRLKNVKIDTLLPYYSNHNLSSNSLESNTNIFGQLSEKEIYKINENINKEVNYINLKNKISKLKKKIKSRYSAKNLGKTRNDEDILVNHPLKDNTNLNEKSEANNQNMNNSYKSNLIKKMSSKINLSGEKKNEEQKFRYLKRKNCLYDSIDDEEYDDEVIDYYISPNSLYIKIIDIFLLISSFFYFIFVPNYLSTNFIILKENTIFKIILILIDIIYIIDLVNSFFRAYQDFDEHLIRSTSKIIIHFIKTWFFLDLIQAIPYFSIFLFFGNDIKEYNNRNYQINPMLYILLIIKVIKVYKMLNDNSTISYLSEILVKDEILDNYGGMIIIIFLIICVLNLATCLFIFLGFNSYPNWIFKLNIQDDCYTNIYLTSVYFIIVTITTVGYGDITGGSMPEITFQILLLIVGTIAYSFTISYISNYIIKIHQKSMTYEKNIEILREIRLHNPNMKNSLYLEVLKTLHNEQLFERKDKHLLFDCLPYSLKNELIIEIYKPLIQNFIFFKDVDNSDFIIKVATSLKSLISIKGDVLIQEGDFIKEIIFVKSGVLGLNICIDLDNLENSIKKYLGNNEIGKFDVNYSKLTLINHGRNTKNQNNSNLYNFLTNKRLETHDSNFEIENIYENTEDIKIIEIRRNEHFGDALMFLNERCPLIVKVRTQIADLFILRKMEAIEIYSLYPNIWKRINKKSLYNMEQINLKIKKIVTDISTRYNIKFVKALLKKRKSNKYEPNIKKQKKVKFLEDNKINEEKNKIEKKKNVKNKEKQKDKKIGKKKISNLALNFSSDLTFKNSNSIENSLNSKFIKQNLYNQDFSKKKNDNEEKSEYEKSMANLNKNNNSFISIIKNNSFEIINKKNENNKKKGKNGKFEIFRNKNLEVSVQRSSFAIDGKSSTINEGLKESNKANKSNDSNKMNDSRDFLGLKNQLTKKSSLPKNEDIFYNAFVYLTSTKENSLQLKSSYENINKISNNKYIKDIFLQNKTKHFIIEECLKDLASNNDLIFHHSPTQNLGMKFHNEKLNSIKSNLGDKINDEKALKKNDTLKKYKTNKPNENIIDNLPFGNSKRRGSVVIISNNKLDSKFDIFKSGKNTLRKSLDLPPKKFKRKLTKKKLKKVNKNLKSITQNIENTNNAINNPNEFYMNFFNKLIQKGNENDNIENEKIKLKNKNSSCNSAFYSLK